MGFFLPVPPLAGGATEKAWDGLAKRFASLGHEVTCISRRWPGLSNSEVKNGIKYVRVSGFDHRTLLILNIILDFIWGIKVFRSIPSSDAIICNTITLPVWLGWLRPKSERIVVHIGRMPKGQTFFYKQVSRIYAPSRSVSNALKGAAAAHVLVVGYPIEWNLLAHQQRSERDVLVIGYVGRIHPEKGVELLVRAALALRQLANLPMWKLVLTGPSAVTEGGGGTEWMNRVRALSDGLGSQVEWRAPEYEQDALAAVFGSIDIFCYPSIAERGETFGVAVAEAMAARCSVVVSDLGCFKDLVQPSKTGLVFDHNSRDAPSLLAHSLSQLLRDGALRNRLASQAQEHVRQFDYGSVAERVLEDLALLTGKELEHR